MSCDNKLYEEGSEISNNVENLELSLSDEIKTALMYIAWYITRNDNQPSKYKTHFYLYIFLKIYFSLIQFV